MKEAIFRKKSMERVNSPDQLNDYIRAASPGVWLVLAALIILLAGICVWGVFGRLDTVLEVAGVCENGALKLYVPEEKAAEVRAGMAVAVDGNEYELSSVSTSPVRVDDAVNAYAVHVGGLQSGQWVYPAYAAVSLPDGVYQAQIITERIAPVSFVVN